MGSGGSFLRRRGFSSALAFITALATFLVATPDVARAATFTVCAASSPSAPCDYTTISAAVNAAAGGDVINVAPGNYADRISLTLGTEATVGKTLTVTATGGPGVTTITPPAIGDLMVSVGGGNSGALGTLNLNGFTLTGGNRASGGAIWVSNIFGVLNLSNSVVTLNTSSSDGGGILNWGVVNITGSTISNNTAATTGGGVSNSGTMTISDSVISGNTAAQGGGAYTETSSLGITHSLTVTSSTIDGNTASVSGGGIGATGGTTAVTRSTISGNTASQGAGVWVTGESVTTNDVTIWNSTVANNTGPAVQTSGAGTSPADVHLWYTTVAGNTGTGVQSGADGTITLARTLVATNGTTDCSGHIGMAAFNLIGVQGVGCTFQSAGSNDIIGTPASPVNPKLGLLADNGGPTATFALLSGSPAIDAADTPVGCGFNIDQRGVGRPQGPACDIGAFELEGSGVGPLQTLINNTAAGETVNVPAGTYNESISIGEGKTLAGVGVIIVGDGESSVVTVNGPATIQDVTVTGGGIGIDISTAAAADVLLDRVQVRDNGSWGVSAGGQASVDILRSTIGPNNGGGVMAVSDHANGYAVEVVNSTISGNTGSGFYADAGSAVGPKYLLDHVTITDNPAGIDVGSTADVAVYLRNSIVAGNVANDCVTPLEKIISLGRNVIGDDNGCASWISTDLVGNADTIEGIPALDPMLGLLDDNGGSTPTHALLVGSPAIDHAFKSAGFTSFDGTPKITTNGSAQLISGRLRLTSGGGQAGTAFWQQPVLLDGNGFSTTFDFEITNPVAWSGAPEESSGDGLTFVIAPSPTTSLGGGGGYIGIGDLPDTVVVEFDTFSHQAAGFENSDPPPGISGIDHVGIDIDGNMQTSTVFDQFDGHFDDGAVWTATVTYDGLTLDVSVTNGAVTGSVSTDVDIAEVVGNGDPTAPAYFGFSSGTGAAGATHDILDWAGTIDGQCPATDQRGVTRPAGPACDSGAFEIDSIIPTALTVDITDTGSQALGSPVIPIENLNIGTFFGVPTGPASTQLGAIQLGAIQLGAIGSDLTSAAGHMTIKAIIDAAAELSASPSILDGITLVDLPVVGGWAQYITSASPLYGRPDYTITLRQAIDDPDLGPVLPLLRLADSGVSASQLGAIQLGAIQLGSIQLGAIQLGSIQLGAIGAQLVDICGSGDVDCEALGIDPSNPDTYETYSIMALSLLGVDLGFAQLGAIGPNSAQLGAIQLGAIDPSGTQLGAIQLGAIQLGAINLARTQLGSIQLGAIQLGSIQLGAIQLGAIQLGAIGDKAGLVEYWCNDPEGGLDCAELGIVKPASGFVGNELDGYSLLALGAMGAQLGAIQLGAIQLGAIDNLASTQLGAIQLGAIQLGAIDPSGTQLGAIQLGAIQLGSIQLGAIQLGAIDWSRPAFAQLGAIQLGAIQLGAIDPSGTQLGAIQLGAIQLGAIADPASIISCGTLEGGCSANGLMTLHELQQLGLILPSATLADLAGVLEGIPLQDLADGGVDILGLAGAATLLDLLPDTTIAELPSDVTLGQISELWVGVTLFELLLALLNPADLNWEDVDPASIAADHPALVAGWSITFKMAGEPGLVPGAEFPFSAEASVSLPNGVVYRPGTAVLVNGEWTTPLPDPVNTGGTLQWVIDGVVLNDTLEIRFDLATSFVADTSTPVSTTVNTLGFTASDSLPTFVTDIEPNDDFLTATTVSGDVVVLGRMGTTADIDMFKINVPAGGSIEAYLNPGGVDLDLVLFEPGATTDGELRGPAERVVDGSLDPVIGVDPTEQDQESLDDIAHTDVAAVFKASLHRSSANETIVTPPLRNGGEFFLQVTAYNREPSDATYVGRIRVIAPPVASTCDARPLPTNDGSPGTLPAIPVGVETLYLMNTDLYADTYGGDAFTAVLDAIAGVGAVPGAPIGVVIPVEGNLTVRDAYTNWLSADGNCSVDAANDTAVAIAELADVYRGLHPTLKSVVFVGGDDQIPFFRVEDQGTVANERSFAGEFTGNNPLVASLRDGYVLTDAPYTDANPLYVPAGDREVFVSQMPMGRLVETPAEIVASLNQYVASGGFLDTAVGASDPAPTARVLGYDFLADASLSIKQTLTDDGFTVTAEINETWPKSAFVAAMDSGAAIVNGNAHFDYQSALPAAGNLSNVFTDLYSVTDLKPTIDPATDLADTTYAGTIIYTMGCHAGLNAPANYLSADDDGYDWAQALLERQAVYIANTGFGYGDSEFQAYSEELMALLTEQFATSNTIGEAFMTAGQVFTAQTPKWSPYHDKSLMEATLYGLPFYKLHESSVTPATIPTVATVAYNAALQSAGFTADGLLTEQPTPTRTVDRYFEGDDVLAVPYRPVQPLDRLNVTPTDAGLRPRGAIVEALSSTDIGLFDVLYARPILYNQLAEPEFETTGPFPNAIPAISSSVTPSGRADNLLVARGRYFPGADGIPGTQQLFDSVGMTVYYAPAGVTDIDPPNITRVAAVEIVPGTVVFEVEANDASGILRALVLYKVAGASGAWTPLELTESGGVWSFTETVPGQDLDFFVQVLAGDGQTASSTDKADLHDVQPPAPPGIQATGVVGNNGIFKSAAQVTLAQPTNVPSPVALEYSTDGGASFNTYEGPFAVVTEGATEIKARPVGFPQSTSVKIVVVDTVAPAVNVAAPASGIVVERDSALALRYTCSDAQSGVAKCRGTVLNGGLLDTSVAGVHEAQVTGTDRAGNTTKVVIEYTVLAEAELVLTADATVVPIDTVVNFTVEYTGDDQHGISWTFGDMTGLDPVDQGAGPGLATHAYIATGVYPVTVTVSHGGGLIQTKQLRYIVVYDPSEGFVTGGGWIQSPPGAYTPSNPLDADLIGRADFGFVSKYKKGATVPTGNTAFKFSAADFEFNSTSYEWLVVQGTNKAAYKGVGVIEGWQGEYKFRVTVRDADGSTTDAFTVDAFRIKIWTDLADGTEVVIYDNGLATDPDSEFGGTTPLSGGSIKIHVPKKK
jgi:hypothetical protein